MRQRKSYLEKYATKPETKYQTGEKYGKWEVLYTIKDERGLRMCRCVCGNEKIIQIANLLRAAKTGGGCRQCSDSHLSDISKIIIRNKEQQKEIIEILQNTKETKVFEKLPEKLNISVPRTEELNTYIKQAEELLKNTADIHFSISSKHKVVD